MTGPKVVGTIPTDGGTPAPATPSPKAVAIAESKPTRVLPTDRVGFPKQLELLRAYAALAAQGTAAPGNTAAADLVGMHKDTARLALPFFLDVGLLTKSGDGYIPSPEVLAYGKAFSWSQDTAGQRLGPLFKRTWFAQALLPRLAMGQVEEGRAVQVLGEACGATPRYEGQIKTLLNYLTTSGVIRRDGDTIREGTVSEPEAAMATPRTDTPVEAKDVAREVTKVVPRGPAITTSFAQVPEGVLRIAVDVNVDLREFSTWRPERITAFWAGIAQVLAAKAGIEQGAGS
jgi:hypothetical protein